MENVKITKSKKIPLIGVVIVNYLTFADTIKYIRTYLLTQVSVKLKIVIVDNNSPGISVIKLNQEFSRDPDIFLLSNRENKGYAAANNIGVRFLEKLDCKYILISNNDIRIFNPKMLARLVHEYSKLADVAFVSPVMLSNNTLKPDLSAWKLPGKMLELVNSVFFLKIPFQWCLTKYYYNISLDNQENLKVDCLPGSFFLCQVKIFSILGYFDEKTFLYYEELILANKVRRLGLQNYLIQSLTYEHYGSSTIDSVFSVHEKHKILLKSKIYYWSNYYKKDILFLTAIKILYAINSLEWKILLLVRKLLKKNSTLH